MVSQIVGQKDCSTSLPSACSERAAELAASVANMVNSRLPNIAVLAFAALAFAVPASAFARAEGWVGMRRGLWWRKAKASVGTATAWPGVPPFRELGAEVRMRSARTSVVAVVAARTAR